MPIGKYRGQSMERIAETAVGRSYLRWAAGNIAGNVGTAARITVEFFGEGAEPAEVRRPDASNAGPSGDSVLLHGAVGGMAPVWSRHHEQS
jgi:hypothetical protein